MEKMEETLRIQREGMAQAQRLLNESANLNLGGGLGMNPAGMIAGITSALTLTGIFGISTKGRTGGINITALSVIFFVLFLICNLVFAFTAVKVAPYVIINGILLIIYTIQIYGIIKKNSKKFAFFLKNFS